MMPFATVLLAVLTPFAAPQEPGEVVTSKKILLQLDDVVLHQYAPEHVTPEELLLLVRPMIGREFFVQERGGFASEPVRNLSMLADRLIIYDSKAYLDQVLEAVRQLDQPSGHETRPSEPLETTEYVPRYLSLLSVNRALEPYRTQIAVQIPNNQGRISYRENLNQVHERNLLVIRDTRARTEDMLAVLKRIDVPEPQALVTCHLIQGKAEANEETLPRDLVQNMHRLLPHFQFESIGFAMLQTSVAPGRGVELTVEGGMEVGYQLSFQPVAFEATTASLTVQNCTVSRDQYQTVAQGPSGVQRQFTGKRQIFSTNTIFRGGEYTVLGATGAEPVFLVVRLDPVGN